jgi:signal transduction histidine kinase/ActR/RegA family two-component response regulator
MASCHDVQFYESESFLDDAVSRFAVDGLRTGDPLLVLATARTREALHDRLAANGVDPGAAKRTGRLVLLDAEETLARFMAANSMPDGLQFHAIVGEAIRRMGNGHGRLRAYGEMVDVLWRDGRPRAALRVEELWNELASRHSFHLLCAYELRNFERVEHAGGLEAVCAAHGRVRPAESYREDDDAPARMRQIALLQQRARALETEIERRRELEAALRLADRRKDEFLAMLAHELRNPLSPMLTALQLLRLRGEGGNEREVVERQVRHLSRLVDDLLDVSRISQGKIRLDRSRIELSAVLAKAVEMASPLVEQRGHALAVEVPQEGLAVDGDPVRLAQVFANVLSNAAKYTDTGGNIALTAVRDAEEVVVSIRDDGIGISPDVLPTVFDLFVQGERGLDRAQGGLGIGLTLARNLLELHGGSIRAASAGVGAGSEFEVRLPLAVPEPPRAQARHGKNGTRASAPARRVLVVDDNEDAAEMLAEALRWLGHEVAVANDGASALGMVASFRPDVALLDIGLPGIDGYELARALRARLSPAPRLLALSGYGQDRDRVQSREAGFDVHLVKPVDLEVLATLLDARKGA